MAKLFREILNRIIGPKHIALGVENGKVIQFLKARDALKPDDLLVQIKSVAVNPIDFKLANKTENKKVILGFDAYGVVVNKGDKVTNFKIGDKVFYSGQNNRSGSFQELQVVDSHLAAQAPNKIDTDQIASIPLTFLTAYEILKEQFNFKIERNSQIGEELLIINGSGGVGLALLQLANYIGLKVTTTTSSTDGKNIISKLGNATIIDRTKIKTALGQKRFKNIALLYDPIVYIDLISEHLQAFGTVVSIVDSSQKIDLTKLKELSATYKQEFVFTKALMNFKKETQGKYLRDIALLLDAGIISPVVTTNLSGINVNNLQKSLVMIGSQKVIGKIVLSGEFKKD
ncbi:MAG: alcohol dehydrogenase catalytic domain-containing protein [Lactobacillaceae bacterium]|jgi:NADPH:quinone reductase-like Zn-dependent oxidoreductase|nr:alcohol dehydrogenase catalytic domain-containing protein [Lactobacillaceae bacterium]